MALKTALAWSGLQTAVRMLLSFASIKVTSVYLGPTGLALVGQLANFVDLVQGGLGNAIQSSIVKLTAEAEGDKTSLLRLWGTASRLATGIGAMVGLIVIVAAEPISGWLLHDRKYWPVIFVVGLTIPLLLANKVLIGVLNGLKQIKIQSTASITSAVFGALIFISLSYVFGIWGGLIGAALVNGVVVAVTVALMGRSSLVRLRDFCVNWQRGVVPSLFAMYPMLLVHSIAEPATLLWVRNALASALGIHTAGLWQATTRLSDMYTTVLITALSLYLMAHLSAIRDELAFNRELRLAVVKITVLSMAAALMLFLFRDIVVAVVFTHEFEPVRELLAYQLVGDVFKMAMWPLQTALVIKLRYGWYIWQDAAVAVAQVGLTYLWLPDMATQSATAAYAVARGGALLLLLLFAYRDLWLHVIQDFKASRSRSTK